LAFPLSYLDIHPNPDESVVSSNGNTSGRSAQAFSHPIGHLAFADKGIGPGRERGLLAGIQMADQDNDDRGWAGQPQFGQSLS
jgi:hypothetical protein